MMRELVDADSATVPAASTGGDAPQKREIVSRGNRACGSKVGTLPRKAWIVKSLVGHMSVSKRVGYGGVDAWWECCTHNVGIIKAGT